MKFTKLSILIIGSLIFAGCSYGKSEPEAQQLLMETDEYSQEGDEAMEVDESMMEENALLGTDEIIEADDSVEASDRIVADESIMPGQNMATVQLNMSNYTFGVEEIEASVGETLVLAITNDNGVHDFVIDELGVSTGVIPEGETMEVTIPTDKPGTYEYYCSVGKHRDLGMKGTITIYSIR